ncbi:MAG: hypothetical protein QOG15_1400 [Solirubrobacteraceae bacterium]|nr:hypothetical protein [Solirubrobacteraceae bacterium]
MLAAAPAIAGCASDDVLSPEAVARAADRTAAKGGVRVAIDQTITLPGQSPISMTGSGVIDPKAQRGHITLDLSRIPGLPNDIRAGRQEVIFEHFTMYMRSPLFAASLPEGKRWLKVDFIKAGRTAGVDLGALAQQRQDPTQALRYLEAASGDVKRVGAERVRGVDTTHYRATIDLLRYADVVPANERASVRHTMSQIVKLAGADSFPMEVWIGQDGVVRRMRQRIRTLVAPGIRGTIDQRIELFDFGTRVRLQLPPPDEIEDATDSAARGVRDLTQ